MDPKMLELVLPFAIVAIVMAFRIRGLRKAKPFKAGQLWIAPAVVALVVGFFLWGFPPDPTGWLVILFGGVIGAMAGIKRGQWMHLERDPGTGNLLIRQSPAALIFLAAIFVFRRALTYELGVGGADSSGHLPHTALLVTDGLLGFAFAMVVAMRWTLWQRAKAVPPHPEVFS